MYQCTILPEITTTLVSQHAYFSKIEISHPKITPKYSFFFHFFSKLFSTISQTPPVFRALQIIPYTARILTSTVIIRIISTTDSSTWRMIQSRASNKFTHRLRSSPRSNRATQPGRASVQSVALFTLEFTLATENISVPAFHASLVGTR